MVAGRLGIQFDRFTPPQSVTTALLIAFFLRCYGNVINIPANSRNLKGVKNGALVSFKGVWELQLLNVKGNERIRALVCERECVIQGPCMVKGAWEPG